MSREELKTFVKTVEHNVHLKEKLVECKTSKDLILLAKQYGYTINLEDLTYWNVELQEPYFSYKEASEKREIQKK